MDVRRARAPRRRGPDPRRARELAFVGATASPTNLCAQALCPTPAALHRYLTERLGALEHVRSIETSPVLRTVKALD
ncbi:hypothetical protein GCM10010492_22800 [Saccharothrix mutabilis subsp. mutabilis]|uniref:Transcription regulator AsnC/Lrp ligand binding domain-containing protein n=1 Tax=Saccharothrix mutabilis subsp. mutabilis TaxID=66855 RepID=A0ABN0TKN4_9PSEU